MLVIPLVSWDELVCVPFLIGSVELPNIVGESMSPLKELEHLAHLPLHTSAYEKTAPDLKETRTSIPNQPQQGPLHASTASYVAGRILRALACGSGEGEGIGSIEHPAEKGLFGCSGRIASLLVTVSR